MNTERTAVQTVQEVSALLAVPHSCIAAGGTTFDLSSDAELHLVDISGLEGMDGIKQKGNRIEIGPLASLGAVGSSVLLKKNAPALTEAASLAATPEIRERGTIGGNLGSFLPGDLAVALMASGAKLTVKTESDFREIMIDRFWNPDGKNDLQYDEWITRITIQIPKDPRWGAAFAKMKEWDPTSGPSAAAAVQLSLDGKNRVIAIRGSFRHDSGKIRRMFPLEKVLKNNAATDENLKKAVKAMISTAQIEQDAESFSAFLLELMHRSRSMAEERRTL